MAQFTVYKTYKTVAKMKADTGFISDVLYLLSEAGKEGYWYYDSSDTTTAENTGLVLVTTTGSLRLKRRLFSPFVYKSWFTGAVPYFASASEVNSTIPLLSRFRSMKVMILDTVVTDYWYRDGTADGDLVPVAEVLTLSNGPSTFDRTVNLISAPTPSTLAVKSLGLTTVGGATVTRTSTSTTEDWEIDTSALVTFSSGVFADRPISALLGQQYYQTDLLEGSYRWDGLNWTYVPDDNTEVWCKFLGSAAPLNVNFSGTGGAGSFQDGGAGFSYWRMETGTDTTGLSQLRTNLNLTFGSTTGKTIFYAKNIYANAISDGTNRFILRLGRAAGADGIGMFFKYSDDINSGKWQCICHNGTSATTVDSGVTFAANTPKLFLIVHDQGGTDNVKFYIDNVLVATITTNLPVTTISAGFFGSVSIEKTLGAANRALLIDDLIIKRIL